MINLLENEVFSTQNNYYIAFKIKMSYISRNMDFNYKIGHFQLNSVTSLLNNAHCINLIATRQIRCCKSYQKFN